MIIIAFLFYIVTGNLTNMIQIYVYEYNIDRSAF